MNTNVCPKCNATFDQLKKFCGKCGVSLVARSGPSRSLPNTVVIMTKLEELQKRYKDLDGGDLLIGGYISWTNPDKLLALAKECAFTKGKSFDIDDEEIINVVTSYLKSKRMVIVVAWSSEKRIDLYR